MAAATTTSAAGAALLWLIFALAFLTGHPADGRPVAGGHHHQGTSNVKADIVAEACANATRLSYEPHLTMEYCVSTLRSDKRSAAATHARDLALVAMDLLQRGAADADARLAAVPVGKRKDMALTVHFCRLDYGAVPKCRPMLQEYKPGGGGGDGNLRFYNYMDEAALDCWENIFLDDKLKEMALNQVREVANRANLVDAMIEQMVGESDRVL
ncbi:hypothetical protein PVAP13_3KG438023 [Panicum virgatum]|uniref:Pectinesterase inhibitor domain-containing protein n=1 Tax=Panicum virgatum TaxID=38727 RepID=A0A8T0V885_PANVG|nr:hypothetical protein PVAP13_3KG438023 [Panicum virgatum]